MRCIILAAGKGTRLKPLTDKVPKPLLPIENRPLLAYTLEALPQTVTTVTIIIKHLGERIKEAFGSHFAKKRITYLHATSLKGSADMARQAKRFVKGKTLFLNGDDLYTKEDLSRLTKTVGKEEWGILAASHKEPEKFGRVIIGPNGTVQDIVEQGGECEPRTLVNAGAYVLDERYYQYRPVKLKNGEYGLPQTMLQAKHVIPIRIVKALAWHPINNKEDYNSAKIFLLRMQ